MSDIVAFIIVVIIALIFIVGSIIMLAGKGGSLVAGYNTMSKHEKSKYDEVALSKFMGKTMLPVGILFPLIAIGGMYDMPWLIVLFVVVTVGLSIFSVVYTNKNFKRFEK